MLSGSDLLALGRAFLELQESKWSILNGFGNLTFRAFQKCIIIYTFLQIRQPKSGDQRQPPAPFQASSAQRVETSVETPREDPLASVPCSRDLLACEPHQSSVMPYIQLAIERSKNDWRKAVGKQRFRRDKASPYTYLKFPSMNFHQWIT